MKNCSTIRRKIGRLRRPAVTLIELLIVVGLLTILATLSLTTVKGLLKDQKVTQAAQLVEQYFETARVRAWTNGRPVAVFMERSSVIGDGAGNPTPANFTCNRLSIGEVFPPYTGDVMSASGSMWDVNMDLHNPDPAPRHADGFADQIRFLASDVLAGFGAGGFVSVGDTIEFEGYNGRFAIEAIDILSATEIAVTFFNPPEDYNQLRFARIAASLATDPTFEATHARVPPQIPVTCTTLTSTTDTITGKTTNLTSVRFRVYRRPTKSLVGTVTLPRGTCIDLSASGFGLASCGAGDASSPFYLSGPPIGGTPSRSSYSRIGVMFTAEGRLGSVIVENNVGGTKTFAGADASQVLSLMVGRTGQVVPGDLVDDQQLKLAILQSSLPTDRDQVRSNLLDPANSWITCNPFTGEIKSSPVNQVTDATVTTVRTAVQLSPTAVIDSVVFEARSLSTAGVNN